MLNSRCVFVWLAAAVVAVSSVAASDQEVRVFQLRFRTALEAAALVEPLLSDHGSLVLPRNVNAITVRDNPTVLRRVADALAGWDVAPESYRIRIRLLMASTPTPAPGRAGPLIEGMGADMSRVLGFTSYQEIDTLQVTASDGAVVEATAGERYHLRFMVRSVAHDAERIHLNQFELSRRQPTTEGRDRLQVLMRTAMSLKEDQEVVVALARSEAANRGLILVVWAQREGTE